MSDASLHKDRFGAIEAYLLGTMDLATRDRFEEEMAADPLLRDEVELQRENIRAVELAGVNRTLQAAGAEYHEADASHARGSWTIYLKYAAMVAVLILGAVWWLGRPRENERLFAEYYEEDPGLPVPMSAVSDPIFQDAMVAYKLGDFGEARGKWGELLHAKPDNDTLRFYIGNAYLAEGNAAAAIPLFKAVAEDPASAFRDKARWFLFLACLHEGRLNELPDTTLLSDPAHGELVRAIRSRLHS
jgi:hypothetical protein